MTATAKLFRLGKAQAVRIPARFRMAADEVEITQQDGVLILRPKLQTAGELFAQARSMANGAFDDWKRPQRVPAEAVEALEP